jgi:hypothetical protein
VPCQSADYSSSMIFLIIASLQAGFTVTAAPGADRTVMPVVQSAISDQALEQLAARESRLPGRLNRLIYDAPSMRAEIKRVGFEKGCHAIADSRREVSLQFVPALVPPTVAAIRKIVPEPRLSETRPRSFVFGPMRIYANRIDEEIDRTASDVLTTAYDAMRTAFLTRTHGMATTRNPADNIIMPRPDIAAFGSLNGPYNLDNPAHLSMACADLLTPADRRPTITTLPAPRTYTVVPPQQ